MFKVSTPSAPPALPDTRQVPQLGWTRIEIERAALLMERGPRGRHWILRGAAREIAQVLVVDDALKR
ncbi:MAG TPA: hypothetical protein VHO48_05025, partial [Anaerolineaceae bacterium]|nr:hypothetical protein [Anaerolineaceae bacterium]